MHDFLKEMILYYCFKLQEAIQENVSLNLSLYFKFASRVNNRSISHLLPIHFTDFKISSSMLTPARYDTSFLQLTHVFFQHECACPEDWLVTKYEDYILTKV